MGCTVSARRASNKYRSPVLMPRHKRNMSFLLMLCIISICSHFAAPRSVSAGTAGVFSGRKQSSPDTASFPREYGEVIYRYNEKSPNHIYIIGTSHRDSLTLKNGYNTVRAQVEAYKIGEWLIRNKGLELLLPEGFFSVGNKNPEKENAVKVSYAGGAENKAQTDTGILEKRLGDNTVYVNAEMLLKENYLIKLRQVEDRKLYDAVGHDIFGLEKCGNDTSGCFFLRSELEYLQERRTAAMLQAIPDKVDYEFLQGNIQRRDALFTIGMSHLYEIIKYLRENKITIYSPLFNTAGKEDYIAELNLLKKNYGITIILPKALADDDDVLKRTRLNKIIEESRKQSSLVSSAALPQSGEAVLVKH